MTVVPSDYVRAENDLYQTEPWATLALLRHFPVGERDVVWEPFAGNHLMSDVIVETGAFVITSDIRVYDRQHNAIFDFIEGGDIGTVSCTHLISNPPYGKQNRLATKCARIALQRCKGWVALLLTAKFDSGSTRPDLFALNPRFAGKVVLTDRIQWFPGEYTGTEDHAWYVWSPEPGIGCGNARLFYESREGFANVQR